MRKIKEQRNSNQKSRARFRAIPRRQQQRWTKNASFAGANARRIRTIKANGYSRDASLPIKVEQRAEKERERISALHDRYVVIAIKTFVSKEIAVLGGEVLVRDRKEISRPEGARRFC